MIGGRQKLLAPSLTVGPPIRGGSPSGLAVLRTCSTATYPTTRQPQWLQHLVARANGTSISRPQRGQSMGYRRK